jgi:phage terminase large subunit
VEVVIPYAPRPLQRELHDSLARFSVIVAHRRFGKTVFCINHALRDALQNGRERPRYGYVAPFRNQAKQVAWDYLKQFSAPVPGVAFNEAELRADLPNGGRIQLFGADNYDAMRGIYFDGVILDEYAQMSPRAWDSVIRPALTDRGGWAIFIGTPMGRNQFWKTYDRASREPDWYRAMFRASESGVLDEKELEAARREMPPELYEQEFECSFQAAIIGAVYGKQVEAADKDGRIRSVPWEPKTPVHTAWDLGIGDSTVIWWVQQVGQEVRFIDYYEASGVDLAHYVRVLRDKPYVYGEHILPHDASVKELGSGLSRVETLESLGMSVRVLGQQRVEDGINAARMMFPRCWFDEEKCRQGVEALRQYRYDFDDKSRAFKPRPVHDWTSHAADGFRYAALGLDRVSASSSWSKPLKIDTRWIA